MDWIRAKKIALIKAKNPRLGRLGGEVALADGVGRGSDQGQVRKLLDPPLPEYARMRSSA
ncbi:MAG TPA: hypothetical protein VMU26_14480 [Candidatus Polarisedimenticolia bacterium]|nr:hypothetical protein [Candidatus Polarisedimenticolia bacterium]